MTIEMFDLAAADRDIRFSPYCWRIRMALAHKGLDVTTIPVCFGEKDKIAFSGQKLVPVIRDKDHVVSDSWAIALYLDEAYPDRPMLFEGAQARALAGFFRHYVQTRINVPVLRMVIMDIHDLIREEDRAYFRSSREARFGKSLEEFAVGEDQGRADLKAALAPMRDALGDAPFFCGSRAAFADYVLFGSFMWARNVSKRRLLDEDDPVYAWRERMLDLFDGLARKSPGPGA